MIMKKILLSLLAVIGLSAGASAMSLKEAFKALSNIPNVSLSAPDYNLPVTAPLQAEGGLATAYNLDAEQIKTTGDAAMAILNQVPIKYMINGGCNNEVLAFVYATPTTEGQGDTSVNDNSEKAGKYDMLIAVMSGYRGMAVFLYGTVSGEVRDAFQAAPLKMEGNFLSCEVALPDNNEFNIMLNKAR